jgi:hypothetical protein
MIRLGFAGADITPEKPAELVGFHREDNLSRGVLKPLAAQVSVWEAGERCCLIAIDSIGFTKELTNELRNRVHGILDIPAEKVMICFSHTHAAPEADCQREYFELVCRRVEGAVIRAMENMGPVSVGRANGKAVIGVNRRKASDETDDRIGVLKACDARTGKPVLAILRVTAHGNVLKRDNLMISPDYFGDVRETAGNRFGCPVMVIQGSAGNTAPKYFDSAETPVDAAGDQYIRSKTALADMAALVTDGAAAVWDGITLRDDLPARMYSRGIVLESEVPTPEEALRCAEEAKSLCGIGDTGWLAKVNRLNEAGIRVQQEEVEIQYFFLGDWCLCGGPYEFMVGFALEAERLTGNEFFYVNGYTNGCLLYFPTEEEYDLGGYEVFWSLLIYYVFLDRVWPFRRESASKLIRFIADHAQDM